MRVISLGWGVQSFTLAAMAALGVIEPVDYAIHADTGYESVLTYEFAERWSWWLEVSGVNVITVKDPNAKLVKRNSKNIETAIPAFSEIGGMLHRQCTGHWKIEPIRRFLQSKRNRQPVEMLLGISIDEWKRMRDSNVKYITNSYPLIDKKMSRRDCMRWLVRRGLEIPSKSACYFCPFHSTNDWNRVKKTSDWEKVIGADKQIRDAFPGKHNAHLYLHASLKPIEEVDFRSAEEKGQMTLWDNECSGMCGV